MKRAVFICAVLVGFTLLGNAQTKPTAKKATPKQAENYKKARRITDTSGLGVDTAKKMNVQSNFPRLPEQNNPNPHSADPAPALPKNPNPPPTKPTPPTNKTVDQ